MRVDQVKSRESGESDSRVNLVDWRNIIDLDESQSKCETEKFQSKYEFYVCHETSVAYDQPMIDMKYDESIAKILDSALEKYPSAGLFAINPLLGVYSMQALKSGRKVFAVEMYALNVPCLKMSAKKNGHLDTLTLINNAISDNIGDFAIDDAIRYRKPAAVRSVRMQDVLKFAPFTEAVLIVVVECKT